MTSVLRFLETVDLCGLFVLVLALLILGNKMSQENARVRAFCASLSGFLLIAYIVFRFLEGSISSGNLAEVTFRGLLASGFVLGASWILLPPMAMLCQKIVDALRQWRAESSRRYEDRKRLRSEQEDRRRREEQYAASAPERERAKRQAQEQSRLAKETQRRREHAHASCEVLFAMHSFDIRERFTREMFDAFIARHFGDDKSAEYVEKLAGELSDIIRKHLQKAGPAVSVSDLDAARKEVQACYDEHADLLRDAFPPVRFRAELKVRFNDSTLPQDAWKEARDIIHELLLLVAEEKQNRKSAAQPKRKINPPVENI